MKKWWIRNFKIISIDKAIEIGLVHVYNVYGDEINYMKCRSVWKDEKGRIYRVKTIW